MSKIFAFSVAILCAASAMAQPLGTSRLKGMDSKAPVDIDADRIEVLDRDKQAIFTGNVVVRQAELTINADRIRVNYKDNERGGDPMIQRLDADGRVRLTSPSEQASARYGIYDVPNQVLTLVGGVSLAQGKNRVAGNRLTIDLDSGRSVMDGKSESGTGGSRVTGRFTVPERN